RIHPPTYVDDPLVHAVGAATHGQTRQSRPVLHADEQQRLTVVDRRARVQHGVDHLGELLRRQDRVARVPLEDLAGIDVDVHGNLLARQPDGSGRARGSVTDDARLSSPAVRIMLPCSLRTRYRRAARSNVSLGVRSSNTARSTGTARSSTPASCTTM